MAAKATFDETGILAFLTSLFEDDLHAKRILSLSQCTLGVVHAASLAIHSIGIGMAEARGVAPKHAIKQVDRMLSNKGINVWALFRLWVPFVLGLVFRCFPPQSKLKTGQATRPEEDGFADSPSGGSTAWPTTFFPHCWRLWKRFASA